jgi:hypothetical protein
LLTGILKEIVVNADLRLRNSEEVMKPLEARELVPAVAAGPEMVLEDRSIRSIEFLERKEVKEFSVCCVLHICTSVRR